MGLVSEGPRLAHSLVCAHVGLAFEGPSHLVYSSVLFLLHLRGVVFEARLYSPIHPVLSSYVLLVSDPSIPMYHL